MRRKIKRILGFKSTVSKKKDTFESSLITSVPEFIDGFLTGVVAREGTVCVLQCGANDGVTVDPVNRFLNRNADKAKAVLVEPLPDVFEQLSRNYADSENVICLNKALGPEGRLKLYRLKAEYSDRYRGIIASGITSFDRTHVLEKSTHLVGIDHVSPEDRIEEIEVECMTVSQMIDSYAEWLGHQPFIQIDAEGFDDEVIHSIDFARHKPIAINYEFNKLPGEKLVSLRELLDGHGYKFATWSKSDELAYLSSA